MTYRLTQTKDSKECGVVLLMAILIASVALAVGFGIYNRTFKQLYFASFWKQTQIALTSAEAGLECVLAADLKSATSPTTRTCFGGNFSYSTTTSPWTSPDFTVAGGCAKVTVTKTGGATLIQSRGYNDACGSTNPRRVERGVKITY